MLSQQKYTGSSILVEQPGDPRKMGGSNPHPCTSFQFRWAEKLYCQTGVYNKRWYIKTPWFSIRLHHWFHSDDARNFHDHPWSFVTIVLKGGYTDISPQGEQEMKVGSVAFRPALHRHTVKVNPGGCWSLVLTGPEFRKWGFWVKNKFKKANKYFLEHGKHVCD